MRKEAYAYNNQKPHQVSESIKDRIFEELPTAIAVLNANHEILFANKAFCAAVPAKSRQVSCIFNCKACVAGPCSIPFPLDTLLAKHRGNGGAVTQHVFNAADGRRSSLRLSDLHESGAFLLMVDLNRQEEPKQCQSDAAQAALNHRIRSVLQIAKTLAVQTAHHSASIESFLATYEGRLTAFSQAQCEIALNQSRGASLRDIVGQMVTLARIEEGRIKILAGPDVDIPHQETLSLRLGLHELLTNALKHGSLSTGCGLVEVSWKVTVLGEPRIRLSWKESGGPKVAAPKRRGFGMELIEDVLSSDLNAKVKLRFEPQGVQCEVDFPLPAEGRLPWY